MTLSDFVDDCCQPGTTNGHRFADFYLAYTRQPRNAATIHSVLVGMGELGKLVKSPGGKIDDRCKVTVAIDPHKTGQHPISGKPTVR